MTDEFKSLLGQAIEAKKSADLVAQAKVDAARIQRQEQDEAERQRRLAGNAKWDSDLNILNSILGEIQNRSAETGIVADLAEHPGSGRSRVRSINFHAQKPIMRPLRFTLRDDYTLSVESAMGNMEFDFFNFKEKNYNKTIASHFSLILSGGTGSI